MKQIRYIFLSICLCMCTGWAHAQSEIDALRHSQATITGTARSMGMGGAYSAVGADLGSATINPAGLAVYRSSAFSISPAYVRAGNQGEFLNTTGQGTDSYFGVPSWGFAFTTLKQYDDGRKREEQRDGLKSFTFAIGHNQLENYTRNMVVQGGFNDVSSLSDMFAERAQGIYFNDLPDKEYNAWSTFVIDTILGSGGLRYFPAITAANTQQDLQLQETGRRNEWFISLAGNFSDRFYIGGTVGIQRLRYEYNLNFIETDIEDFYQFYQTDENSMFPLEIPSARFTYTDNFSTNGTGINAQIGMIYRPIDHLRLALSFKSPTLLSLTDEFSTTMTHIIQNVDASGNSFEQEEFASSDPARFQYQLTTPYRLTFGAMYLLGKRGLVTADVEMIDYSTARLKSTESNINSGAFYDFVPENQAISDLYQMSFNVKLGGEFRQDIFRVRVGGALLGSPLTQGAREYLDFDDLETIRSISGERRILSLGAGIRQPNYHLDVSFINQAQQDLFSPYFSEKYTPTVISTRTVNTLIATLGFSF